MTAVTCASSNNSILYKELRMDYNLPLLGTSQEHKNYGGRSSVGRALDCGSSGRGFKSRRSPHFPSSAQSQYCLSELDLHPDQGRRICSTLAFVPRMNRSRLSTIEFQQSLHSNFFVAFRIKPTY